MTEEISDISLLVNVREEFVDVYETKNVTLKTLIKISKDILIRFQVSTDSRRG